MSTTEQQVSDRKEWVRIMGVYLNAEMWAFVATIPEPERKDYFDGRNSDLWQAGFGQFLQRPREFASND